MKTLSDNELRGLNKNALIKTIKELQKEKNNMACLVNDLQENTDEAIEKLKEHKHDLDYEPWSEYKINGSILFDLVEILQGNKEKE